MLTIPKPKICSAGNRVTSCSRIFCFCSQAFLNAKEILSLINRVILEWIQHTQTELLFCVKKKGAERKSHHSKKKLRKMLTLLYVHMQREIAPTKREWGKAFKSVLFSPKMKSISELDAGWADRPGCWSAGAGSVSEKWPFNSDYGHLIESNERGLCSSDFGFSPAGQRCSLQRPNHCSTDWVWHSGWRSEGK